jgi:hypothetical protein
MSHGLTSSISSHSIHVNVGSSSHLITFAMKTSFGLVEMCKRALEVKTAWSHGTSFHSLSIANSHHFIPGMNMFMQWVHTLSCLVS